MGEGNCLVDISETLGAQGHYVQGEALCSKAVCILREAREAAREGRALCGLGLIRYYQGDYARARTFLKEARSLSRDSGPSWVESKSLVILSLILHAQGHDIAARDFARQALENGPVDYHLGQGDSALALGHALSGLGDTKGATAAYQQALQRYRQAGFLNPPVEARAGLARLELAWGAPALALDHVEEILAHLQDHSLDGTYEPFRIYLTCVRVLQAHDDPRATEVRRTAYTLLQERAAGIEDERLRRSFLENVPAHRELLTEYEQPGPGG
jgi:tetratricopeptide (TPR) repeat protein